MFWGYKSIHQSAVCAEIGSINAYCSKRLSGHCLTKSWKLYYSISLSFTALIPFLRRFHPICSFKWNLKHNGTYSIYLDVQTCQEFISIPKIALIFMSFWMILFLPVDHGFAIGSFTQLHYWEILLMMNWKITPSTFLAVVRYRISTKKC